MCSSEKSNWINLGENLMDKSVVSKDHIDYAERAGLENIRFRLQIAEALNKDTSNTLTILLGGIAGLFAVVLNGAEGAQRSEFWLPAFAGLVWLVATAMVLVIQCVQTKPLQVPTNEPANLYAPKFELDCVRLAELENLNERIKLTILRNRVLAAWLDRCRLAAVCTPLVSLIVWAARAVY